MLVAGIDGGQSSTTAVVMNESAEIVGRGVAGPSDHVDEPADSRRCADACESAVARALADGGWDAGTRLDAVVAGLSGYDGRLHGAAPDFECARVRFVHDAPIALAGAIARRPAVVVIAGTGSVAYAEDAAGGSVRVGGYGYVFGDEGSSFALARAALAHAMALDDRGRRTGLGDAALAYFDRPTLRALARAFYIKEVDRPQLAAFARVVFDAARLGDAEADALVEDAARALASLAAIALERLGAGAAMVPVAFTGGMTANAHVRDRATAHVREIAPNAQVVEPAREPAAGAALLALADAGITAPA
ncbi:MAG: BadF/BadG/BcrA/BcrD ATPase family protein [Candidatus Velthaea sp.]